MDLDILDATEHYEDDRGYHYVGISDSWKRLCMDLPDSKRVKIPIIYKQQSLKTTIDGKDVVLQVWKGNCPHAYRELPGGIGGEVGIYRIEPDRSIPDELVLPRLDEFPDKVRPLVQDVASRILRKTVEVAEKGVEWWWPYVDLNAAIQMKFINPKTGLVFFEAAPEPAGGYWMSRWMSYGSYARYELREVFERRSVPSHAWQYRMEFAIGSRWFRWDDPESAIQQI